MDFKTYLIRKGLSSRTITSITHSLKMIKKVNQRTGLEVEEYRYEDVLNHIQRRKRMGTSTRTINIDLSTLRKYFDYLILEGIRFDNPAKNVIVKGGRKNKIYNLLSEEKLAEIYKNQPSTTPKEVRNKVILGLLIYQGLSIEELSRINTFNIDLEECVMTIPIWLKSNERTISLKPKQLFPMMDYIANQREKLNPEKSAETKQLIISEGSDDRLAGSLATIKRNLKKQYKEFENWQQIRTSVITHKLTPNNLRQMQYYFGFKYIDSIERYLEQSVDDLREELDRCFGI